jgi:hypothetical protein
MPRKCVGFPFRSHEIMANLYAVLFSLEYPRSIATQRDARRLRVATACSPIAAGR